MGKLRCLLAVSILSGSAGCNRQDAECLEQISHKLVERAGIVTESVQDRLGQRIPGLGGSAAARVSTRLRWDKALAELTIKAAPDGGDGVVLKGTIHNEEQRRRAVELAESTLGVNHVKDALELAEPDPNQNAQPVFPY